MGKYLTLANEAMGLQPENRGRMAEFDSPLFGRCYGRIQEIKANVYQLTVTKRWITIGKAFLATHSLMLSLLTGLINLPLPLLVPFRWAKKGL